MIVVDTSILIEALAAGGAMRRHFRGAIADGERLAIPTLVLYEWLRGPRLPQELAAQEALLPAGQALTFGREEAEAAARLYGQLPRARGRELDIAIAAVALVWQSPLWTANVSDFEDMPGLALYRPSRS